MKQKVGIAIALALLAGVIWWRPTDDPQTRSPLSDGTGATGEERRSNDDTATPGLPSTSLDAARQHVADAKLALQAAVAERKAAEADLQQAERDVEELERWIADIEERGEDPVDYADEGLARLQPAFFAYQDAFDRFELAESMESAALEELAANRGVLARIIAASDDTK